MSKAEKAYRLAEKVEEIIGTLKPKKRDGELVKIEPDELSGRELAVIYLAGSVFASGPKGGSVEFSIPRRTKRVLKRLKDD